MFTYRHALAHAAGGPGAPRSPLYGIWNVEELTVDGEIRPAVLNDYDRRWPRDGHAERRRLSARTIRSRTQSAIDTARRAITPTRNHWRAAFTFDSPSVVGSSSRGRWMVISCGLSATGNSRRSGCSTADSGGCVRRIRSRMS
jgi:hypothetical protein